MIPYYFISVLLKAHFDSDVSFANGVAIDVAECALPGKMTDARKCALYQRKSALYNEIKGITLSFCPSACCPSVDNILILFHEIVVDDSRVCLALPHSFFLSLPPFFVFGELCERFCVQVYAWLIPG